MQLTLVVPELVWPEPDDRDSLDALPCDGLNTLLARSRLSRRPPQSVEATLCDAFGLGESVPYGALRVLGEDAAPAAGDACWLCADPVHLRLHQERLILADGASLNIERGEAQAIVDQLNHHFADFGTFHVASPDRWYLELAGSTDLGPFDILPLSAVAGRSVSRQLPATDAARRLRQLLNEAQMVLHQHPANRRREDEGRSTINSLWLWGAGILPTARPPDFSGVWSDGPLARGLARAFAVPVHALPDDAAAFLARATARGRHLIVLDALQSPVQYEDGDAYRARLGELDQRWFAPLQKALAAGRIARLRLEAATAYAALAWESDRRDQWKLWRRPQPLAATAQALARGDP
ncbi:MAG: hypothetical protein V5B32_05265 [Candidatus Accumulibacter sp. UW26]|jgi:hypothetical protein